MKIAYLVNQYPHASHTFIRSEIEGLESLEVQVERITVVESRAALVDDRDHRERGLLRLKLKRRLPILLAHAARTCLARPRSFLRGLATAWRMGRSSPSGRVNNFGYLLEACVLLDWTTRHHVEHVHAHFGTNSTAIALLCRRLGGPTYSFTVHGTETFDAPAFLSLTEKTEHAEFVATVSWHGHALMMRWMPVELWDKIRIVRCFPDPLLFDGTTSPPRTDAKLACIGRLAAEKGIFTMFEATAKLAAEGLRFQITMIGDGPLREDAERYLRELGIESYVELVGWGSNQVVKNAILGARALVHPSYAEGLPVAMMEALALGRPVIATYVGGVPELVRPGIEGWIVPAGSVDDLADAMRSALTADTFELTRMGRNGRKRLGEMHRPSTEIAKLNHELRAGSRRRAA
ncbi:MAG: glycosyltransferase [Planctomycetota bacterium]|nr:glycosyltransferase [Planctomycetota bacterium]